MRTVTSKPTPTPDPDPDGVTQVTRSAGETRATEVELTVRSMRKAMRGEGLFQTLVPALPVRSGSRRGTAGKTRRGTAAAAAGCSGENLSLRPEPSSSSMALCQRWISFTEMISTGLDTRFVLGDWMELVAQWIGPDETVDSALECFLHSSVAYVNSTDDNLVLTDKCNLRALRSIRAAILSGSSELLHENVLISIILLHFVEVCKELLLVP
jgi:hypothetical protein